MESGVNNYLDSVLSTQELSNLPLSIQTKINTYIQNVKLDSAGDKKTSKDVPKKLKNNEDSKLLLASNETVIELEKQISVLDSELEKAKVKISSLENDVVSLKNARDTAIDEKNELTRILQRRDTEIERLLAVESTLSQQLKTAINEKCEALALYDEIKSNKLSLQNREKYLEQERNLLNSQITGLSEEIIRLSSELQTSTLNNNSKLLSLQNKISELNEELKISKDTIEQLNKERNNLTSTVDSITQRLTEQQEINRQMAENYMRELDAKTELANVFKIMNDGCEAKILELTHAIDDLQKLLNETTEKCVALENKSKQLEVEHEESIQKYIEKIDFLNKELDNANESLKAAKEQNINMTLNELVPSAAEASKLLKSSMTLTDIYSKLVKTTDELTQKKIENVQLQTTIDKILLELEEKAPFIQKQKEEYEEALQSNACLTEQIDTLNMECNNLRAELNDSVKINNNSVKENSKLKEDIGNLSRQVCYLLKNIEKSRGNLILTGDDLSPKSNVITPMGQSSDVLKKTMVTFSDIQELQDNNQKLLRLIRELRLSNDELQKFKAQFENNDLQHKIKELQSQLLDLKQAQASQTTMVNSVIRQRDMYKKMYEEMNGRTNKSHSLQVTDTSDNTVLPTMESSTVEIKLKATEEHLQLIKDAYNLYKEEKIKNENMLFEQIDEMRKEITKLTAENIKFASISKFNDERLNRLHLNILTYRKQISALENERKTYNITIAKQEDALQRLRDEVLSAQTYIAKADTKIQHLTLTNKLMKETEVRLHLEIEVLNRERQGQAQLVKNLELVKASMERVEVEGRTRLESNLDEIVKECSALRKKLQEEQDKYSELSNYHQRQTETANLRVQEEKDAADLLRKEITQLRQDLTEKSKSYKELANKFKDSLSSGTGGTFDNPKRIQELKNSLVDKDEQLKILGEQLSNAKEQMEQYSKKAEAAHKEMQAISSEYKSYKDGTEKSLSEYKQKIQFLEAKCSQLEAEVSLQGDGGNSDNNTVLKKVKEELQKALSNNKIYEAELQMTREKLSATFDLVQKAEEKYNHEMLLHSTDIQALTLVREELAKAQNQINELNNLKNVAVNKLETEKAAWIEKLEVLTKENEELTQRYADLCNQNSLLHNQIQEMGTQLNINRSCRSLSDSVNESREDSTLNVSESVDERKSSEQLCQVVQLLKKEKDILLAKNNILQAETMRLKSQLEIAERQLDRTKLSLLEERDKFEVSIESKNKQSDVLCKLQTLDALLDSNRILRTERDRLSAQVDELTTSVKALEEQMTPCREKVIELTSQCESLKAENADLKADTVRWRTRVNALIERANKTSPEDWKRLQNERETLAKMLTNEKENIKKLTEEMETVKIEKSKLEEKYTLLSRQYETVVEENNKLSKESQSLKSDLESLTENITKIKGELSEACINNAKLTKDLTDKEETLVALRNKEAQIKTIAKKYKAQYEQLTKQMDLDKKQGEMESDAANAESTENKRINELQSQLKTEQNNCEIMKRAMQKLRSEQQEKEKKVKVVLEEAKKKILQLNELRNSLATELDQVKSELASVEQSTRDEHSAHLAAIKSEYESRISRLEKELAEAVAERNVLQMKVNSLQRHQQPATATEEIVTTEPQTANIEPMPGVAKPSVSGIRTSLGSVRPTSPTEAAADDAHTTEYMPASSSRPIPCTADVASTAPAKYTQDPDVSEAGAGSSNISVDTEQTHSQSPQQVALVLPPVLAESGDAVVAEASALTASAEPQPGMEVDLASGGPGAGGVSTSQEPVVDCTAKRRLRSQSPVVASTKRMRLQGSVEVEYQVPTSSRCDQDDEVVKVLDSEDEEHCSGTTDKEGEEDEDVTEAQEIADGSAVRQESPAQSPGEGVAAEDEEAHSAEADSEPAPIQQIEAISSGTEPSRILSLGGNGRDDDSIVPSTPTLCVPRRNDGFSEVVESPEDGVGEAGARFTFSEATASHQDSHADLASSLPPQVAPSTETGTVDGEQRNWEENHAEEGTAAVSSQGSEHSTPQQVREEGREAEARARPAFQRGRYNAYHPAVPPSSNRWMRDADSGSGARGRGMRQRGRPPRRSRYMRY